MTLAELLGQDAAVATLRRGLLEGRLHHALLFVGPRGVGKETAAFALAAAFSCIAEPRPEGDGCGVCSGCHRATTRSTAGAPVPMHPDVVLVRRGLYPREVLGRTTDEKVDISVDQIRRVVLERAAFPPHEGRARIIIIEDAHELSVSAANALLKTLEEPRPDTRFVLLSDRPGELLPTVRSRTLSVRFSLLHEDVIATLLERRGLDAARARAIATVSDGSMARAAEVAAEGGGSDDEAVAALRKAVGNRAALFDLSATYANTSEGRAELVRHLRALLAADAVALRRLVREGNDDAEIDAILRRAAAFTRLREPFEHNANTPLALEAEWMKLG